MIKQQKEPALSSTEVNNFIANTIFSEDLNLTANDTWSSVPHREKLYWTDNCIFSSLTNSLYSPSNKPIFPESLKHTHTHIKTTT